MSLHWPTVALALAATVAFLLWFPAPAGCGCARRKRALDQLGEEWFGDAD